MKEQFKISYNYSKDDSETLTQHWLVGCKIIEAETFLEAQEMWEKEHADKTIRDIELVREN